MEFERFNNIFNQLIGNYLGVLRPATVEIIFKHLNSYLNDMQMQQDKGEAKRKFMHHYWLKSLFMCNEDELKIIIKQHFNKKLEEGLNYLLSIYYWKMSYKQIANKEFLWHDFANANGAYGLMQIWWLHRQVLKNGFKELLSTEFERGLPWKRGTKVSYNKIKAFYFDYYLEREFDEQEEDVFSELLTFICAIGPVINKYNIYREVTLIIDHMVENSDKFYFQSPVKFLITVKDIK